MIAGRQRVRVNRVEGLEIQSQTKIANKTINLNKCRAIYHQMPRWTHKYYQTEMRCLAIWMSKIE